MLPRSFVYVKAPLRLSLSGGGTDWVDYFQLRGGVDICTVALDYNINLSVRRISKYYNERFRLEYYNVEHCQYVYEIKNDIIRGVLTFLHWEDPLHISVISDLPSSSGLGSSSSFTVALLVALLRLRGEADPSPYELSKMAIEVELNVLNREMGIQDCLPAAFGGFSNFRLYSKDVFVQTPLLIDHLERMVADGHLWMIWTGGQRESGSILGRQKEQLNSKLPLYDEMAAISEKFSCIARQNVSYDSFRAALLETVQKSHAIKLRFAEGIASPEILLMLEALEHDGVHGLRIVGAGGGGCLLCVGDFKTMTKRDLRQRFIPLRFSSLGARVCFEELS